MNMNRQGRLYSLGHSPVVRCPPGRQKWERMKERPSFEVRSLILCVLVVHKFVSVIWRSLHFLVIMYSIHHHFLTSVFSWFHMLESFPKRNFSTQPGLVLLPIVTSSSTFHPQCISSKTDGCNSCDTSLLAFYLRLISVWYRMVMEIWYSVSLIISLSQNLHLLSTSPSLIHGHIQIVKKSLLN